MAQSKFNSDAAAFLKTATASPDFENLPLEGIPDEYSGPTFTKKDFVYTTVECLPGGVTFIVVTPTAGSAYYEAFQAGTVDPDLAVQFRAGTQGIGGLFPDATTLFPGCGTNGQPELKVNNSAEVVEARLVAHSAEMVVVNNAFTQFGTISTYKTPLNREITNQATGAVSNYHILGTEALFKNPLSSEANVAPVREGSYSVAMSKEADFNFFPALDDVTLSSSFDGYQTSADPPIACTFRGPAVVWDNGFDSIVFRVEVPEGSPSQVFILKIWRTWEMKPAASSLAHSIAHASPPIDRRAIDFYHELAKSLPVSVPSKDNPDFWATILEGIKATSAIASSLPMPRVAAAGKGVHAIAEMIDSVRQNRRRPGRARPPPAPRKGKQKVRRRRRRR